MEPFEMMPHTWGWGVLMGIVWLLIIALLVVAVVYAVREVGRREYAAGPSGRPPSEQDETPRDILDRRYAEGELSREEYEQMKADLEE